jgi:two-component system, chemotaxis family, protein-glutamate methylesterase/glutaminase
MIVDDSAVVRGLLARWLEADGEIEVVRSVGDGAQAIAHLVESEAEIAILDIDMPVLGGIEALPKLLALRPHLKVLISSTLTRRNAIISLKALSLGASDYVAKPETVRGVTTSEDFRHELIAKIKTLGAIARRQMQREQPASTAPSGRRDSALPERTFRLRAAAVVPPQILAVGSSTGGPQALMQFFAGIGRNVDVPMVITQHMPPTFTAILAEQIGKASGAPTREAEAGDTLRPGHIYVAPGGFHLTVRREGGAVNIVLDDGPAENFCRPAVDPMFRSLAAVFGPGVLGVVLTGMGQDGREGARQITGAGGSVLVQDQASSVVWGMPGAVAEAGYASAVLPLAELAPRVIGLLRGRPL